ncbi:hypothetical protein NC653_011066 [Populus alba x Populus x berolinensis]|uniref:Uncharacterized protein n=1 Tax=Populus alba x Populus x berolinensis TaxID=444605 RepID=A0AAD6R2J6_9ROSI|nr:hypothetical protein NC653_011066 [Populus alba x Populus x berolinensis]
MPLAAVIVISAAFPFLLCSLMKRASIRTYFPDYKGYLGLIPKQNQTNLVGNAFFYGNQYQAKN